MSAVAGDGVTTDRPGAVTPHRIAWANSLRGIAAVAVMAGHLLVGTVEAPGIALFILGYPGGADLEPSRPLAEAIRAIGFDLMPAGVCIFFLLSGYVIAISLRKYSRAGFVVGRSMRILPTYAVGYLVCCVAAAGLALLVGYRIPMTPATVAAGVVPGVSTVFQLPVFINGVAWTLMVELAFYGLCVVFFRRLCTSEVLRYAIVAGCLVTHAVLLEITVPGVLTGVQKALLVVTPYLPILLIGVSLEARHSDKRLSWSLVAVVGSFAAASWWMTMADSPLVRGHSDLYRITNVITVLMFVAVWRWAGQGFDSPLLRRMADISYPLYVVHLLIGWVVIFGIAGLGRSSLVAQAAAIGVVVLVAWALHVTVEVPTHRWGTRWARSLSGRPAPEGP